MTECPVCGAAVIGQPSTCDACGTPLDRVRGPGGGVGGVLPFLLPGMRHLWKGYLLRGGVGLFGTFTALLWLLAELQRMELTVGSLLGLTLWAVIWTVWSLSWHWNRLGLTTRRPSAGRIVSSVMVLLVLSNVLMLGLVIGIFTGTRI